MNREEKVERFLENLRNSADANYPDKDHGELDPYKSHQAWPGRRYKLVGNSFNVESKLIDVKRGPRRKACIGVVLEKGRGNCKCVSIEDALKYQGFVEILSRFEYDWLSKQPPSTLIGPAYNKDGNLLTESFAVWRRQSIVVYEKETASV